MKKESVSNTKNKRNAITAVPPSILAGALMIGAILTGCGTESEDADPALFRYDAATGQCRDGRNQIGFNPYTLRELRHSQNAECVDLSGLDLILLKKDAITFENDSLTGWNFKGARFHECGFHFNNIIDGQLQGADFSRANFGYVQTTGVVDSFTKPPAENCMRTGDRIDCRQ